MTTRPLRGVVLTMVAFVIPHAGLTGMYCAFRIPIRDPGEAAGRAIGLSVDSGTNDRAKGLLKSRLKDFGKSHCNEVFSSVIDGYKTSDLESTVDRWDVNFYNINSTAGSITQNQAIANGSSTTLDASINYGTAASTLSGTSASAVLLGANFFSNSNSVYQGNVLLHEILHVYTGWDDADIVSAFSRNGLVKRNCGTEDISAWLAADCKSTSTSETWWSR